MRMQRPPRRTDGRTEALVDLRFAAVLWRQFEQYYFGGSSQLREEIEPDSFDVVIEFLNLVVVRSMTMKVMLVCVWISCHCAGDAPRGQSKYRILPEYRCRAFEHSISTSASSFSNIRITRIYGCDAANDFPTERDWFPPGLCGAHSAIQSPSNSAIYICCPARSLDSHPIIVALRCLKLDTKLHVGLSGDKLRNSIQT